MRVWRVSVSRRRHRAELARAQRAVPDDPGLRQAERVLRIDRSLDAGDGPTFKPPGVR